MRFSPGHQMIRMRNEAILRGLKEKFKASASERTRLMKLSGAPQKSWGIVRLRRMGKSKKVKTTRRAAS